LQEPWEQPSAQCRGYMHSFETCGTVDGPGIRFVLFLTGCPLRCLYCHNPDTQHLKNGKVITAEEIVKEVVRYKPFIKNGGFTISGGEPLSQQSFTESVLFEVKRNGLHTALDTSGCFGTHVRPSLLELVDLVLLDIKGWTSAHHLKVTGKPIKPVIEFAEHLAEIGKPTWIRFVLVPGLTDDPATIEGIAQFASGLSNVELVEVLPFHKYGEPKYEQLHQKYALAETREPTEDEVEAARSRFRSFGLKVR